MELNLLQALDWFQNMLYGTSQSDQTTFIMDCNQDTWYLRYSPTMSLTRVAPELVEMQNPRPQSDTLSANLQTDKDLWQLICRLNIGKH